MGTPTKIVKRDGRVVPFDQARIKRAIEKCFRELPNQTKSDPQSLADVVVELLSGELPKVEQVQDIVERVLQESGEFEAAKRYILYRAEHTKDRERRPIPDSVKQAFKESESYFPTPLQQFQFYDKYSRFNYNLGRRETWVETVDRAMTFLIELSGGQLDEKDYSDIRTYILNMWAMPSMRLIAMAGKAAHRNNICIYNCFRGNTTFVTDSGVKTLLEKVGETENVLCADGRWRPAKVSQFGRQDVFKITLMHWNGGKHGDYPIEVFATRNHRWILADGMETTELRVGDKLLSTDFSKTRESEDMDAVRHGFVFGDGTLTKQNGASYAQVRLCGKKSELLDVLFPEFGRSYPESYNGDPVVYCGRDNAHWKSVPVSNTPDYVAGFIRGLTLADGYVNPSSGNIRIDTQNESLIQWIKENAGIAGYKVISEKVYNNETNYGKRSSPLHQILIGDGRGAMLRVESIEWAGEEDVFCVTEPVTGTFVLGNGQVTGNCSYMGVDSIDAFVEALVISMSGCGVGYSVESQYVDKLPSVEPQTGFKHPTFIVPDSSEGWASALRTGFTAWFGGKDVDFDYSLIRKAGVPLKTKGGRASGPDPLKYMLGFARERILSRQGSKLHPLDAHDIMCAIGSASIQGGVRRTALISLFDYDDHEMRNSKTGDFERNNSQRWSANNSAVWPKGITQTELLDQFLTMVKAHNGEPGIFNRDAANAMKPERRKAWDFGTNPLILAA